MAHLEVSHLNLFKLQQLIFRPFQFSSEHENSKEYLSPLTRLPVEEMPILRNGHPTMISRPSGFPTWISTFLTLQWILSTQRRDPMPLIIVMPILGNKILTKKRREEFKSTSHMFMFGSTDLMTTKHRSKLDVRI